MEQELEKICKKGDRTDASPPCLCLCSYQCGQLRQAVQMDLLYSINRERRHIYIDGMHDSSCRYFPICSQVLTSLSRRRNVGWYPAVTNLDCASSIVLSCDASDEPLNMERRRSNAALFERRYDAALVERRLSGGPGFRSLLLSTVAPIASLAAILSTASC